MKLLVTRKDLQNILTLPLKTIRIVKAVRSVERAVVRLQLPAPSCTHLSHKSCPPESLGEGHPKGAAWANWADQQVSIHVLSLNRIAQLLWHFFATCIFFSPIQAFPHYILEKNSTSVKKNVGSLLLSVYCSTLAFAVVKTICYICSWTLHHPELIERTGINYETMLGKKKKNPGRKVFDDKVSSRVKMLGRENCHLYSWMAQFRAFRAIKSPSAIMGDDFLTVAM